ncbi:hypothetical protein ScPMuIL_015342 [Solemya velum]
MFPRAMKEVCTRACSQIRHCTSSSGNTPQRFEKTVNQINLLGRVGRDAELRGTETHPVVVFSVATNLAYTKSDGNPYSRVDWHRVSVFRSGLLENVAVHLKKGDRVYVTGSIQYDEYRDSSQQLQKVATIMAVDIVNLTKRYLTNTNDADEEK